MSMSPQEYKEFLSYAKNYYFEKVKTPISDFIYLYYEKDEETGEYFLTLDKEVNNNKNYYCKIWGRYLPMAQNESVYQIDLNTRKINAPSFIAIEDDHLADIIWFETDRFYDSIDLFSGNCFIQYINATDKKKYFYNSPIVISSGLTGNEKILIPWEISQHVTKTAGTIEFSIQFFKLSTDEEHFDYILNTIPVKVKVLSTLKGENILEENNDFIAGQFEQLYSLYNSLNREYQTYWEEA